MTTRGSPRVVSPGCRSTSRSEPASSTARRGRCVVVAGSTTHLLVRPGYSQGGLDSRDWKSVPLRHWRKAGFAQPTWIGLELVRVARQADQVPIGWLTPEDWNALW